MTHSEIIMHLRASHPDDAQVQALLDEMESRYCNLIILKNQLAHDAEECHRLTKNHLFKELSQAYAAK